MSFPSPNYICSPTADIKKRFLLGVKGNRTLVAIGLNPSLANAYSLDPTAKNIQTLAKQNQCNGWFLLNLYPERTPKPNHLPKRPIKTLLEENLNFILEFLEKEQSIDKIVFCWGNYVHQLDYLKQCSNHIIEKVKQQKRIPYCLGITQQNQPMHPSPLVVNRFFGGIHKVFLLPFITI